ncbi:hypothetical protein BHE74_00010487 [Ensete ventricosum]|nr:hypothetical protein BHE74_00010487 [Ensete ventricosum]RZR77307.1 hypothetical protein BHM03_00002346 [Ensete ventricosum]
MKGVDVEDENMEQKYGAFLGQRCEVGIRRPYHEARGRKGGYSLRICYSAAIRVVMKEVVRSEDCAGEGKRPRIWCTNLAKPGDFKSY